MRRMANKKELDKKWSRTLTEKRMFCSIHLGGSDQSNDLGHNDLGSNDLAPEVQAMFFVAIICVTIIWEAMIEAATLSAMISVAIILGASVKAVWMIVCEECGNKKAPTKLVGSKAIALVI